MGKDMKYITAILPAVIVINLFRPFARHKTSFSAQ
jgi:hypothetical protein